MTSITKEKKGNHWNFVLGASSTAIPVPRHNTAAGIISQKLFTPAVATSPVARRVDKARVSVLLPRLTKSRLERNPGLPRGVDGRYQKFFFCWYSVQIVSWIYLVFSWKDGYQLISILVKTQSLGLFMPFWCLFHGPKPLENQFEFCRFGDVDLGVAFQFFSYVLNTALDTRKPSTFILRNKPFFGKKKIRVRCC